MSRATWGDLPGAELVSAGLAALERGEPTVEAVLVAIGAPRLRHAGLEVPALPRLREPELALYAALCSAEEVDAYVRLQRADTPSGQL